MNTYHNITKQTAIIYILHALDFGMMFFLFFTLTRILSKYQFGIYSLLSASIIFLVRSLGLGLKEYIVRNLAGKSQKKQKEGFSNIFSFTILTNAAMVAILLPLIYFVLRYLGYSEIFFPSALVVIIAAVNIFGFRLSQYYYAKKNPAMKRAVQIFLNSLWAIPVILMALFDEIDMVRIFSTRLAVASFALVILMACLWHKERISYLAKINFKYIKKGLIYSLPLMTLASTQWFITTSDRYILGLFHSAVKVGSYSYIYSLLNFIMLFCILLPETIFPYMVESYNRNIKQKSTFLINSSIKYTLILILPALSGFYILSREVITLVSGLKYVAAIPIIPFLIIFPLLHSLNQISQKVLMLENKTRTIAGIHITGMILNIALNFILIPKYHFFGAAIATTITYIFMFVWFYMKSKDYFVLDHSYLKIPNILASTLIMGTAIAFIRPEVLITKVLVVLLGLAVYVSSLYITKAYVKEELNLIRSLLPKK